MSFHKTLIDWADFAWNPIIGCSRVSDGCTFCYAARWANRLASRFPYYREVRRWDGTVLLVDNYLSRLKGIGRKSHRVFVNSMGDFFHENVEQRMRNEVYDAMCKFPQHYYFILTKRPQNITAKDIEFHNTFNGIMYLGVSIENQAMKPRLDILRAMTKKHLTVSFEPLLENLGELNLANVEEIFIGRETGGAVRRPCKLEWVQAIIDQVPASCNYMVKKNISLPDHFGRYKVSRQIELEDTNGDGSWRTGWPMDKGGRYIKKGKKQCQK